MAGSRTYGGPAYYDSHLPVTPLHFSSLLFSNPLKGESPQSFEFYLQLDCVIIEAFPEELHLCVNICHTKVTSQLLTCSHLILGTRTLAYQLNAPQSVTTYH